MLQALLYNDVILSQVKGKGGAQKIGLDYMEADKDSTCVYSTASQKNGEGQGEFAKLVFLHVCLEKQRSV